MRFDINEELQEVVLAEGAAGWRNATKRHEDEAVQFGGVVANPDARKSRGMLPPAAVLEMGRENLIAQSIRKALQDSIIGHDASLIGAVTCHSYLSRLLVDWAAVKERGLLHQDIVEFAGSQMEPDQDTSIQKSQSQATLEDGGVIIQETEAYKVGHFLASACCQPTLSYGALLSFHVPQALQV